MSDPVARLTLPGPMALLLASLLLLPLACSDPTGPSVFCGRRRPATAVVPFEDPILEAEIREELGVGAEEDLTCPLISGLTELYATRTGTQVDIQNLRGIEKLTNLVGLALVSNRITDISALSGLTSLTNLWLDNNPITDFSVLGRLTNLTSLGLSTTSISTDLSVLSGLTGLLVLDLGNTDPELTDLSVLSGFISLSSVSLDSNATTDISVLRGLPNLSSVDLKHNPDLADIRSLLEHPGIRYVDLINTNTSCDDVLLLRTRGVTVQTSGAHGASICPYPSPATPTEGSRRIPRTGATDKLARFACGRQIGRAAEMHTR